MWVDPLPFREILEEACEDITGGKAFVSKLNYWLFYLGAFDWVYVLFHWLSEGRIYLVSAYWDLWNYTFVGLPAGMAVLSFVAYITYWIAFGLFFNLPLTLWRVARILEVLYQIRKEK